MEVVSKIVEGRWLSKQKLMDLLWEDKEKRICESLFPMPRNFALDRYASTPYVDFMPGYREDIEVGYREQRRKKEAFARRYLDEDGRVKEDSIPILIAYRDGLKTQICYYGDKLRMGPLCEIRQEFKFIFEEEININNNKKGNKYEEIEQYLIENLRLIWFNIIDGRRREYIRKEWRDRFYDFSLEEFGRPMRFKVGALLRERDSILKEAAPYRRQLRRCEYAVASALKGLPVEEKFNGDSMLKVFTSKKVLEYAEHLHEEEEYRTLRDVYGLLVDKSSFLGIEFRYSNFKSFKRAYYRYRQ